MTENTIPKAGTKYTIQYSEKGYRDYSRDIVIDEEDVETMKTTGQSLEEYIKEQYCELDQEHECGESWNEVVEDLDILDNEE